VALSYFGAYAVEARARPRGHGARAIGRGDQVVAYLELEIDDAVRGAVPARGVDQSGEARVGLVLGHGEALARERIHDAARVILVRVEQHADLHRRAPPVADRRERVDRAQPHRAARGDALRERAIDRVVVRIEVARAAPRALGVVDRAVPRQRGRATSRTTKLGSSGARFGSHTSREKRDSSAPLPHSRASSRVRSPRRRPSPSDRSRYGRSSALGSHSGSRRVACSHVNRNGPPRIADQLVRVVHGGNLPRSRPPRTV
jgi:hypothetical protein